MGWVRRHACTSGERLQAKMMKPHCCSLQSSFEQEKSSASSFQPEQTCLYDWQAELYFAAGLLIAQAIMNPLHMTTARW